MWEELESGEAVNFEARAEIFVCIGIYFGNDDCARLECVNRDEEGTRFFLSERICNFFVNVHKN